MKNNSAQSGWWGKGAAVAVVLALGGVAAAPYLVAASKSIASDGEISVEKVVKEAHGNMKKGDGEIKSAAWSADGKLYIGSKNGLSILKDGKAVRLEDFPQEEAKSVACAPDGAIWVAGKKGLHLLKDGKWSVEKSGDMHSVSVGGTGVVVAVSKKQGIFSRDAAGVWTTVMEAMPEMIKEEDHDHEKEHGKDHEKKHGEAGEKKEH